MGSSCRWHRCSNAAIICSVSRTDLPPFWLLHPPPLPAAGRRRQRRLLATAITPGTSRFVNPVNGRNATLVARLAPDWLKRDPVYQAAMEGALLLDEGDEPGLTPAQALAADIAAKEAAGMVGAAAASGTIVAWMYGDWLADSGSAGAVDTDEVSLSAM